MYRTRLIVEVKIGRFKEYTESFQKINDLVKARGWTESTIWVTAIGTLNEVIVDTEYPDLATMEREQDAFNADPEARALVISAVDCIVQGSGRSELMSSIPVLA
jgi:NIPSNAP